MNTKVLFLQPLYGEVFPPASMSLLATVLHTLHEGFDTDAQQTGMAYIDVSRNGLARFACNSNADWTFWADQDMCIPADAPTKLIRFCEETRADVAGGVYFKKHPPYEPVPWVWAPDYPKRIRPYWALDFDGGPCTVGGLGMGCVAVRTDLLRRMAKEFDDELWFVQNIDPANGEAMGEDVWFYDRLATMGVDVWLLPDIECGHVGYTIFHRGNFEGYFRVAMRENWLCLKHGFHENTPGACPGCEEAVA